MGRLHELDRASQLAQRVRPRGQAHRRSQCQSGKGEPGRRVEDVAGSDEDARVGCHVVRGGARTDKGGPLGMAAVNGLGLASRARRVEGAHTRRTERLWQSRQQRWRRGRWARSHAVTRCRGLEELCIVDDAHVHAVRALRRDWLDGRGELGRAEE